jgi:hypothetical protein
LRRMRSEHIAEDRKGACIMSETTLKPNIEAQFAYLDACAQIEAHAEIVEDPDDDSQWFDSKGTDTDISEEVAYLESRRLIVRHPKATQWIQLCDESEPQPVVPVEGTVA